MRGSDIPRRPYMHLKTLQLAAMVRGPEAPRSTLQEIQHELGFRGRLRAKRLLAAVQERLEGAPEGFAWPSTTATPTDSPAGLQFDAPQDGILRDLGYKVGNRGVAQSTRRVILQDAYESELPWKANAEYLAEFGAPRTAQRLQKLANCIAASARNTKRRDNSGSFEVAISHWEDDLDWMRCEFYAGHYDFHWPST